MSKKTAVVAVGGNSLIKPGEKGTFEEQYNAVVDTVENVIKLIHEGFRVVITHGNGPQVGNILIQSEAAKNIVPTIPMDIAGAFTQGGLGYMISQVIKNHLVEHKYNTDVATIVTQVLVDKNDPAFKNPTKPVGPFYKNREELNDKIEKEGWVVIEDAGRGFRRVVASPKPLDILEKKVIKDLIENDVIVIAVGGGGIPVVNDNGKFKGVAAVIDKDFASSLLATEIKADYFIISTGVEKVAINFNKPDMKLIDKMNIKECEQYISEGHFAKGSMLPKIEASMKFLENGGKNVIITSPEKIFDAVNGKTGTHIIP
ncbi:MAG TPA: carbamate kinase [Exilispira sp.]|nr:carbamate kinase [Spirochaetota bacterium]HOV46257.1 carbamate kinase [Exilispira sp.]HQQ20052.1 carbamate kinase [Exilispira sp.]